MKRFVICGIALMFVMMMPQFISSTEANDVWKTYKLIKDGDLNRSKWEDRTLRDGTPLVNWSIGNDDGDEGDYIEFDHQSDTSGKSAWFKLIKSPECVKGIKVKVKMGGDLIGDIRARIGTTAGAYGAANDYAWSHICLRNKSTGGDKVFGSLTLLDYSDDFNFMSDVVYSELYHHDLQSIDGNTYTITMIVDREKQKIKYAVDGLGSLTYNMPEDLKPGHETWWSIGTRTEEDTAEGTIRFYNEVQVLIDDECVPDEERPSVIKTWPLNKEKDVAVDGSGIKIKFNETMNAWPRYCEEAESCCPYIELKNPDTGEYENLTYFCGFGSYIPTKSFFHARQGDELLSDRKYKITIPQDYFSDLAGNGNNAYSFKFRTEVVLP